MVNVRNVIGNPHIQQTPTTTFPLPKAIQKRLKRLESLLIEI
jgi:hypothetical protein